MTAPTPEQLRAFVGPRADYYLKRWDRLVEEPSNPPRFNWAAFWLGFFWLLYRRMYRLFWISTGVVAGITVLEELATHGNPPRLLDTIIGLAIATFFGSFGTHLYYVHTRRKIAALTVDGQVEPQALVRAGGVSWIGIVTLLALILAMSILLLMVPA